MQNVTRVCMPKRLDFLGLINLAENWPITDKDIVLDFNENEFVFPSGLVGLSCLITKLKFDFENIKITSKHDNCDIITYWDRMNFFNVHKIKKPKTNYNPNEPNGRFCELIIVKQEEETDTISKKLTNTLGLETGSNSWKVINYIITEALNNICQHSRSVGYVASQYYKSNDIIRISIGDSGIGLRESLHQYKPKTDKEAIEMALKPCVTGNYPYPGQSQMRNRGVGLTGIERFVKDSEGDFLIWSGEIYKYKQSFYNPRVFWRGTFLNISISRTKISTSFKTILDELSKEVRQERNKES